MSHTGFLQVRTPDKQGRGASGQVCHGYVEAQYEYALRQHEGYTVNQYAQQIISSPGKQDGLAWQNSDASWGGPIGERIARAIEEGYNIRFLPTSASSPQ